MDPREKLEGTVDALFGMGVSRMLPGDLRMTFGSNGRLRGVSDEKGPLATMRIDGGLAVSVRLAQMLCGADAFSGHCLGVTDEAGPFAEKGYSVFAKHVAWCGADVRPGSETAVMYAGRVAAVGRAVIPAQMMGAPRGVAVRVRDSLKTKDGRDRA